MEKVQVDGIVYKGDIHAHSLGQTLIINKVCYMGSNGPHPRKYFLSDNTVVNPIPQPYPSGSPLFHFISE